MLPFSNFMDYLAYLSLSKDGKIALPKECDCIILNHHFNLSHFLVESEEYEEVNLFLPNSSAGKVLTRTIMDRNPAAVDWSGSYIHFQSLRSYAYYKFIKTKRAYEIVGIAFGVAVIGIIIAFIYEIKFTYRDGDLWKSK